MQKGVQGAKPTTIDLKADQDWGEPFGLDRSEQDRHQQPRGQTAGTGQQRKDRPEGSFWSGKAGGSKEYDAFGAMRFQQRQNRRAQRLYQT